jgi:hypothetical protein
MQTTRDEGKKKAFHCNYTCFCCACQEEWLVAGDNVGTEPIKQRKLPLFALYIFAGDCQIADKADDQGRQDQGDLCVTQSETIQIRFPKPVSKRSAHWPSHDVGKPDCPFESGVLI